MWRLLPAREALRPRPIALLADPPPQRPAPKVCEAIWLPFPSVALPKL